MALPQHAQRRDRRREHGVVEERELDSVEKQPMASNPTTSLSMMCSWPVIERLIRAFSSRTSSRGDMWTLPISGCGSAFYQQAHWFGRRLSPAGA